MLLKLSQVSGTITKEALIGEAVGGLLSAGAKAGLKAGRFALATPARRAVTGSALLAGGLGTHGFLKGMNAQHPDAPNPLEGPSPYAKAMRYAVEEMK